MATAAEGVDTHQHVRTAHSFLEAAEREFAAGDALQGSEKLWGAAAHAVLALCLRRGWAPNSHRAMKDAVARLAEEIGDPALRGEFGMAEKFHANFHHGFMESYELGPDSEVVRRFVRRVLAAAGT